MTGGSGWNLILGQVFRAAVIAASAATESDEEAPGDLILFLDPKGLPLFLGKGYVPAGCGSLLAAGLRAGAISLAGAFPLCCS